jgi:ethanolamine ammonia-lyase small subunit
MSELTRSPIEDAPQIAARLKAMTPARVGLGRTGVSQRTRDLLDFQRSHAQARDAVQAKLESASLAAEIVEVVRGLQSMQVIRLQSAASDRATYLQRPDLGRKLSDVSRETLAKLTRDPFDLVLIVADGLSALAIERHVPLLLKELLPLLADWRLAPIAIVEQGRVAIGDEIGALLGAAVSVVLIGERPGLSSPDSLGAYITWNPRPGRTDAERNCISNIRIEGLSYTQAAHQLRDCLLTARQRQLTGVALKESTNLLKEG